eukprot:TRINITY_DN1322_c1_g1_i1.p1 TRINITY_DN1322_c1_g1~~TRINITY_DN1322_c1_g1_i1.p1  ORF type:complete len:1094 (+),score=269.36 TRINITY_DN1322_c1_g1_i1:155-3436(+)
MDANGSESNQPVEWSKALRQKLVAVSKKKKPPERMVCLKKVTPDLTLPWVYKNVSQERKAKEAMLQLWQFLLKEAMSIAYLDRPYYFRAIVAISKRKEFEILALNWSGGMKPTSPAADVKLHVMYRELLVESIEFIIVNLSKSGAVSSIMEFSSLMLAINYLHFTKLTNMILDTVWASEKEKACLKEDPGLLQEVKAIVSAKEKTSQGVDPTNRSVQVLAKMPAYYTALETLQYTKPFKPSKGRQHWLKRFEENSSFLYKLVCDVLSHIVYMCDGMPAEDIAWHLMPGYTKILHALLYHLKNKLDVPQWHKKKVVFECTQMMLHNCDLLDPLVKTLFAKTNIYEIPTVEAALDLLEEWFRVTRKVRKYPTFPKRFDYKHLCLGISILLSSDHHAILTKAIGFIYNNLDMFLSKQRRHLIHEILLEKNFFRLFLHWSSAVRLLYIQLIVNRVVRLQKQHEPLSAYAKLDREIQIDRETHEMVKKRIEILKKLCEWETSAGDFKKKFEAEKRERIITTIVLGGSKPKRLATSGALMSSSAKVTKGTSASNKDGNKQQQPSPKDERRNLKGSPMKDKKEKDEKKEKKEKEKKEKKEKKGSKQQDSGAVLSSAPCDNDSTEDQPPSDPTSSSVTDMPSPRATEEAVTDQPQDNGHIHNEASSATDAAATATNSEADALAASALPLIPTATVLASKAKDKHQKDKKEIKEPKTPKSSSSKRIKQKPKESTNTSTSTNTNIVSADDSAVYDVSRGKSKSKRRAADQHKVVLSAEPVSSSSQIMDPSQQTTNTSTETGLAPGDEESGDPTKPNSKQKQQAKRRSASVTSSEIKQQRLHNPSAPSTPPHTKSPLKSTPKVKKKTKTPTTATTPTTTSLTSVITNTPSPSTSCIQFETPVFATNNGNGKQQKKSASFIDRSKSMPTVQTQAHTSTQTQQTTGSNNSNTHHELEDTSATPTTPTKPRSITEPAPTTQSEGETTAQQTRINNQSGESGETAVDVSSNDNNNNNNYRSDEAEATPHTTPMGARLQRLLQSGDILSLEPETEFDPLIVPASLEVYILDALCHYESFVEDLNTFVHEPTSGLYPDLHFQGPIGLLEQ